MRRLLQLSALLVVAALLLAGCGDGSSSSGSTAPADTSGRPVASAPDATTPPPDATTPLPQTTPQTPTTAQPPAQTTPQQGGGAGDGGTADGRQPQDEPVRVPAAFKVLGASRLTPGTVTVPPFLAVEVSVANPDGARHVVVVKTPRPQTLTLDGGGYRAVRLPGMRAGSYPIELDGKPAAQLIVGGEVGP